MAKKVTNPYYHPEEQHRAAPVRAASPYSEGSSAAAQRAAAARRKKASAAKRRRRHIALAVAVVLGCGVLCVAVYNLLNNLVTGGAAALPQAIGTEDALKGDLVNILCIGCNNDEAYDKKRDIGLTDVVLYVSFDMKAGKISMLQIPRDTYVGEDVPTGGTYKLNAVALHGDTDPPVAALATYISEKFKLPVDYYISIDMEALKEVINALGGLEVTVPFDIRDDYGNVLKAGTQVLDGNTVEFMIRQRHNYKNADIGRLEMQRYLYSALFKKFKSFPVSDIIKVLPAYIQYVKTDINLAKMGSLASKVVKVPSANISMFKVPGEACSVKGQSVFTAHLEATATLLNTYFRPYSEAVPASSLGVIELQNTTGDLDLTAGQSMDSIDSGTAEWGKTNIAAAAADSSSAASGAASN